MLKQLICAVTHAHPKLLPECLDLGLSRSWNGCELLDLSMVQWPCHFLHFFVIAADKKTLAPYVYPSGFSVSLQSICVLLWKCSWCHQLLSADSEGEKWPFMSRRGGEGISGSWRKALSSLGLLRISVMLGCTGSLLFSRANIIHLSQSHFTVRFVWVGCAGKKVVLWKYFVIKI